MSYAGKSGVVPVKTKRKANRKLPFSGKLSPNSIVTEIILGAIYEIKKN
jgi:hypothetical protein